VLSNMPLPSAPFQVEFEITGKCNLRCKYCRRQLGYEPSFSELLSFFQKTKKEINPCAVLLVGGEPFTRKDIFEVLVAAKNLFARIGLSTNGTLLQGLQRKELGQLQDLTTGMNLQVSIDSIESTVNNTVRGNTEKVMAGLDTLQDYMIPFSVGIVLTKINANSLPKTLRFLMSQYTVLKEINLMNVMPEIGLGKEYFNLRAPIRQYFELLDKIKVLKKELGRNDIHVASLDENLGCEAMIDRSGFQTCLAGLFKMYVTPEGRVTPCALLRNISFGNLHTDSWKDIYKKFVPHFLSLQDKARGSQCLYFNIGKQFACSHHGNIQA